MKSNTMSSRADSRQARQFRSGKNRTRMQQIHADKKTEKSASIRCVRFIRVLFCLLQDRDAQHTPKIAEVSRRCAENLAAGCTGYVFVKASGGSIGMFPHLLLERAFH